MDDKGVEKKAEAYKDGLKGALLASELPDPDNLGATIAGFKAGLEEIKNASVANTYEPSPIAGERPVYPVVQKLIEDRIKFGFEKYGTYLMTHNGRKATKDAIQEVLDLLFYLVQKDMEESPVDYK